MMKELRYTGLNGGNIPSENLTVWFIMTESLNVPCCTSPEPNLRTGACYQMMVTGEMNAN